MAHSIAGRSHLGASDLAQDPTGVTAAGAPEEKEYSQELHRRPRWWGGRLRLVHPEPACHGRGQLHGRGMVRTRVKVAGAVALILTAVVGFRAVQPQQQPAGSAGMAAGDRGDAGNEQTLSTFDGAMVRKRAAIAVHPRRGADRGKIRAELQAAAKATVGPLSEATFAVFSEQMLEYLVPEMTFVLPERVSVSDAEAFIRDRRPADVAYYITQPVLVHDVTFAVITPHGSDPAQVRDRIDSDGILADALNSYEVTVQSAGVTIRYFGAVLSDITVEAIRTAMGEAAGVGADRVQVSANEPGPGIELDNGVPELHDTPTGHH
jgi:hypothetical protein